jgi:hypothetical protein
MRNRIGLVVAPIAANALIAYVLSAAGQVKLQSFGFLSAS